MHLGCGIQLSLICWKGCIHVISLVLHLQTDSVILNPVGSRRDKFYMYLQVSCEEKDETLNNVFSYVIKNP